MKHFDSRPTQPLIQKPHSEAGLSVLKKRVVGPTLTVRENFAKSVWKKFTLRSLKFASALLVGSLLSLPILNAFEARIIGVTARIMPLRCQTFNVYSQGYWKNHTDNWVLPQNLGPLQINTVEEGLDIFDTKSTMADKLRLQLLALKLNLAGSGVGGALVPGHGMTIADLADQADALVLQDPLPDKDTLEDMKDLVESVNVAEKVFTCTSCPDNEQWNEEQGSCQPDADSFVGEDDKNFQPDVLGAAVNENIETPQDDPNATTTPESNEPVPPEGNTNQDENNTPPSDQQQEDPQPPVESQENSTDSQQQNNPEPQPGDSTDNSSTSEPPPADVPPGTQ